MKLEDVAPGGDRLATLQVLRDRLAAELDRCVSLRDLAALALRFTDVLEQIQALGGSSDSAETETFNELARRRAARGAPPPVVQNGASVHAQRRG